MEQKKKISQKTFISRVLRNLIRYQIRQFRTAAFGKRKTLPCPLTGEVLTKRTCHVDHIPPDTFERLVQSFLEKSGLTFEQIETVGYGRRRALKDTKLHFEWLRFHEDNAKLRVVSKTANLSIIRRTPTQVVSLHEKTEEELLAYERPLKRLLKKIDKCEESAEDIFSKFEE